MTKQQNTRPSASREIAVKPLTFSDGGYAHNGLGTMYRITFHNDANIGWVLYRHEGSSKTGLGAHEDRDELITLACEDNERRILSALDTTPGNTDPMLIARYDDELRKVQEFLEDFTSHHFEEVRRWNGPSPEDELDPVTESGMVLAFQEDAKALLDKLATPQPEAQPSVRAGAVDALAAYQQADQDGIMVLVSRQAIEECLPALRSLAQEGEG